MPAAADTSVNWNADPVAGPSANTPARSVRTQVPGRQVERRNLLAAAAFKGPEKQKLTEMEESCHCAFILGALPISIPDVNIIN